MSTWWTVVPICQAKNDTFLPSVPVKFPKNTYRYPYVQNYIQTTLCPTNTSIGILGDPSESDHSSTGIREGEIVELSTILC